MVVGRTSTARIRGGADGGIAKAWTPSGPFPQNNNKGGGAWVLRLKFSSLWGASQRSSNTLGSLRATCPRDTKPLLTSYSLCLGKSNLPLWSLRVAMEKPEDSWFPSLLPEHPHLSHRDTPDTALPTGTAAALCSVPRNRCLKEWSLSPDTEQPNPGPKGSFPASLPASQRMLDDTREPSLDKNRSLHSESSMPGREELF